MAASPRVGLPKAEAHGCELIRLALDRIHHRGMLVPDVDVDEHGREVEVVRSVEVPDLDALAARDHGRVERALRRPRVEHVRPVELVGKLAVGRVEVRGRSWLITSAARAALAFLILYR